MPTNEERQEVARKLREWKCQGWRIDVIPSKVCYDLWCELERLIKTDDSDRYEETFARLADLIEPEPKVKPIYIQGEYGWNSYYMCPKCNHEVFLVQDHYCSHCGAELIWDANE